jgi:hypothetical protein
MPRGIRIVFYVGAIVVVTGCAASTHRYQVVPTGRGTYMIPSVDLMGASSSSIDKAEAYEVAASYCRKLGTEMETILGSETEGQFGGISAPEIEFRCIEPTSR